MMEANNAIFTTKQNSRRVRGYGGSDVQGHPSPVLHLGEKDFKDSILFIGNIEKIIFSYKPNYINRGFTSLLLHAKVKLFLLAGYLAGGQTSTMCRRPYKHRG